MADKNLGFFGAEPQPIPDGDPRFVLGAARLGGFWFEDGMLCAGGHDLAAAAVAMAEPVVTGDPVEPGDTILRFDVVERDPSVLAGPAFTSRQVAAIRLDLIGRDVVLTVDPDSVTPEAHRLLIEVADAIRDRKQFLVSPAGWRPLGEPESGADDGP